MLVINRRVGETVQIGDDISVSIVKSSTNQVRIAIDAPADIAIVRTELLSCVDYESPDHLDDD